MLGRLAGLGLARDGGTGPSPWTGTGWLLSCWRTDSECLRRRDRKMIHSVIIKRNGQGLICNHSSLVSADLCLVVLVETSSSLRQASSSWAKVLGGGRGGMAGSWMKGWAGWWLRRWPQLPPPPQVCVWAEEPPKDFLVLWLLEGK